MTENSQKALELASVELSLAIAQLRRRLRSEGNPDELNLAELGTLARLEQGGWMTTAELARNEGMRPQSMGTILAALKQQGLVKRRPHATDGRQIQFSLTSEGLEARRLRSSARRQWLLTAMSELNAEDLETLTAAIPLIKKLSGS